MRKWCVSPSPLHEQTPSYPAIETPLCCCLCHEKKKKTKARPLSFMTRSLLLFMLPLIYCHASVVGIVRLQMGLEMYTVRVQCLTGGVTSPPCLQAVFVTECSAWEGSSLMQGNLSGCNMRLAFQQSSL